MYTKHATRKTKMWWKCLKRPSSGCRGSMMSLAVKLTARVASTILRNPPKVRMRTLVLPHTTRPTSVYTVAC